MAATLMKKNKAYKLVKLSQSDDDRGDHDEADEGDCAVPEGQKLERKRPPCVFLEDGKNQNAEGRKVQ